jgi:drug/metabolite transporter (DMT)-like permease
MLSGPVGNISYLFSLKFISFSKASVLVWTSPIFTAVGASLYLKEKLSNYDLFALAIAFLSILIIQNPFQA